MTQNRRTSFRMPQDRLITEFVKDRPFLSTAVNLSRTGMYTLRSNGFFSPPSRIVQLQFDVPEANVTIWASAEILYFQRHGQDIGTGIRFRNMARCHRELLADLVEDGRRKMMRALLGDILSQRKNAPHLAPPPHITAPLPTPRDSASAIRWPRVF